MHFLSNFSIRLPVLSVRAARFRHARGIRFSQSLQSARILFAIEFLPGELPRWTIISAKGMGKDSRTGGRKVRRKEGRRHDPVPVGGENSQELLGRWRDCIEAASTFRAKREDKSVRGIRRNRDFWVFRAYSRVTQASRRVRIRADREERYIHMFQRVFAYIIFCGVRCVGAAWQPPRQWSAASGETPRVLRRKPLSAGRAEKNTRYKRKNFSLPSDWRLPWQHPGHLGL